MILMIDNYDSFTYNLVQMIRALGAEMKVVRNDEIDVEGIAALNPEAIVLSPGPGNRRVIGRNDDPDGNRFPGICGVTGVDRGFLYGGWNHLL